jgi:hypothetical protein
VAAARPYRVLGPNSALKESPRSICAGVTNPTGNLEVRE